MGGRVRNGGALTRRRLLTTLGSAAAAVTGPMAAFPSRLAQRPLITHGVQSGDVSTDSGMVWARSDRPARMLIEAATTTRFEDVCHTSYVDALPETDFTAKALIENLPPGQDIFYRLRFQDLLSPKVISEPVIGHFRTAPSDRRTISFVWSGDTAGQGWGIDESKGGMRTYATMLRHRPDFFIHCGDSIYADCVVHETQRLPNGEIWRNVVTEEKSKVATTLSDYRGNYKYNLLDGNVLTFNAEVPIFAQWDNHEVMGVWWPDEIFDRPDYNVNSALLLMARAGRAFHEYMPLRYVPSEPGRIYRRISYGPMLDIFLLDMRSYRGQSDATETNHGAEEHLLGSLQLAWLKKELSRSAATWKVIASDTPLGTISAAGRERASLGLAAELADLLRFLKRAGIHNTVWLTADLHYTAAHYFDPNDAALDDFEPFWEFVSGPLHAGTWTSCSMDRTFGLQVIFQKAASASQGENLAPCFGLQFFGHVSIDGATQQMTVTLKDVDDRALWVKTIDPIFSD